ncbi:hypothetical protein CTI12_AA044710 [Artemisia annua]|uniref:Reverse transcriptase domain-containing protein n=1 Tax=Artemisia annua TaxID=35608 RepID=A0A2U1QD44_ARTAN|nr:hypothetical protein CTI12_AA044710 [Artemisia annua]
MKFAVVRSPSPYNIILGRSGIKKLRAIPSTIHSMMKFPTPRGISTLVTRSVIISECRKLEETFLLEKETEIETPPVAVVMDEATKTEEILVHPAYPDQLVTIGKNFSKEGRGQLITLLKNSLAPNGKLPDQRKPQVGNKAKRRMAQVARSTKTPSGQ